MGCAVLFIHILIGPDDLHLLEMADPSKQKMRTGLRLGGLLGFVGGFLLAYQRSSCESFHQPLLANSHDVLMHSPILGLVGERTGGSDGFG